MSGKNSLLKGLSLLIILAMSVMVLLPGCGPAATPEPEPEPPMAPEPEPTTPPAPEPTADPDADKYGGTLCHSMVQYMQRFYPPDHSSDNVMWRLTNTFGTLVGWKQGSAEGEVFPDLAESWDISDDGLEYTFYLREGLKFHNGDEVTAEDAAFSIQAYYAEEGLPFGAKFGNVESVEAVDKLTVKITLKNPNTYFLTDLAGVRGSAVMPKKVVEELGDEFGTSPETTVGSGPFILTEWTDTHIRYEAFDDWYLGRPYLDGMAQKIVPERPLGALEFQAGNTDIEYLYGGDVQKFLEDPELKKSTHPSERQAIRWWSFNVEKPPYDDVRVRQAINYALDQAPWVEVSRAGLATPANQFIAVNMVGHDDSIQYYAKDMDMAASLLADAGFPDGLDVEIYVWNVAPEVVDAEVLAAQLNEGPFNASVIPVDFGTAVEEAEKGTYGFFINGEALNPNTAADLRRYFGSEGGGNVSNWSNPDFDALVEEADLEQDLTKRGALLAEAEKILLEEAVYIPYMYPWTVIAVQPWIGGVEGNVAYSPPSHYVTRFDKWWFPQDKMDRGCK